MWRFWTCACSLNHTVCWSRWLGRRCRRLACLWDHNKTRCGTSPRCTWSSQTGVTHELGTGKERRVSAREIPEPDPDRWNWLGPPCFLSKIGCIFLQQWSTQQPWTQECCRLWSPHSRTSDRLFPSHPDAHKNQTGCLASGLLSTEWWFGNSALSSASLISLLEASVPWLGTQLLTLLAFPSTQRLFEIRLFQPHSVIWNSRACLRGASLHGSSLLCKHWYWLGFVPWALKV